MTKIFKDVLKQVMASLSIKRVLTTPIGNGCQVLIPNYIGFLGGVSGQSLQSLKESGICWLSDSKTCFWTRHDWSKFGHSCSVHCAQFHCLSLCCSHCHLLFLLGQEDEVCGKLESTLLPGALAPAGLQHALPFLFVRNNPLPAHAEQEGREADWWVVGWRGAGQPLSVSKLLRNEMLASFPIGVMGRPAQLTSWFWWSVGGPTIILMEAWLD